MASFAVTRYSHCRHKPRDRRARALFLRRITQPWGATAFTIDGLFGERMIHLIGLPANWEIDRIAARRRDTRPFRLTGGEDVEIIVVIARASIGGRVVTTEGEPLTNAQVTAEDVTSEVDSGREAPLRPRLLPQPVSSRSAVSVRRRGPPRSWMATARCRCRREWRPNHPGTRGDYSRVTSRRRRRIAHWSSRRRGLELRWRVDVVGDQKMFDDTGYL